MRIRLLVLASVVASSVGVVATTLPSVPAGSIEPSTPMLEARAGHSAILLPDGRVLIAAGMRRNGDFYRSAELYDPTTRVFSITGASAVARLGAAAVLLKSGKVLIAGGWTEGGGATRSAELYDPKSGRFVAIASMNAPRGRPSATLLADGDVLIAGGGDRNAPGGVATAEVFHADDLSFSAVGPMHEGRIAHTATLLRDGRVLIVGGRGSQVTASAEIFDLKTGAFTLTGSLTTARYKATAGLLPDGRVLVAGGSTAQDWRGNLDSAEIYDPATGRFSPAGHLSEARFKLPDNAVRLASGRLLITGGGRSVEVYDPASARFLVAAGRMENAWHYESATALRDGTVLLAGGYGQDDVASARTWLYRP